MQIRGKTIPTWGIVGLALLLTIITLLLVFMIAVSRMAPYPMILF